MDIPFPGQDRGHGPVRPDRVALRSGGHKGLTALIGVCAALLSLGDVHAHTLGESYFFVHLYDDHIEGTIHLIATDLNDVLTIDRNRDGKISDDEFASQFDRVKARLKSRTGFRVGGQSHTLEITSFEFQHLTTAKFVTIAYRADTGPLPGSMVIENSMFADLGRDHRSLAIVSYRGEAQAIPPHYLAMLEFTPETTQHNFTLDALNPLRSPWGTFARGLTRMVFGPLHILFIVAVLLQAVVMRRGRDLQPVSSMGIAARRMGSAVALAAIGCSMTLTPAAIEGATFNPHLMAMLLAATVAVVAMNGIVPTLGPYLLPVTFGFALLHGLEFASRIVIELPETDVLSALMKFNAGIVAGLLVIVMIAIPVVYLWRRLPQHARAVQFVSGLIACLGLMMTLRHLVAWTQMASAIRQSSGLSAIATPTAPQTATIDVPVVSVTIGVVGLIVLAWLRAKRRDARHMLMILLVGAAMTAGLADVGLTRIANPFVSSSQMPTEGRAQAIFRTLNAGVYKAFDHTSESDIYDALATCVTGEQLDRTYQEVYESLLAQEDGLICRVESVDVTESSITLPDDADAGFFTVECRWEVKGALEHWEHVHERVNAYHATFTVRLVDQAWKIADVKVMDHKRTSKQTPK